MAVHIESSIVTARPVGPVFRAFLDLQNAVLFDPDVRSVHKRTEGTIGVGTVFEFDERTPPFGRYQSTWVRYVAVEPDRRIDFVGQVGPLSPRGCWLFHPVGDGTRLTVRAEADPAGPMKLLSPFVARQGHRTWEKRWALFKAWIEAEPEAPR